MKRIVILLGALCLQQAYAQQEANGRVGINTQTPNATLNVKSKSGTTNTTKNLELENANGQKLATVLDNGNVGIGTQSPTTKLDLVSTTQGEAFRMSDGTEGNGKVLTSDARGNATWKFTTTIYNVPISIAGRFELDKSVSERTKAKKTPISVTLPPGKYFFTLNLIFRTQPSSQFDPSRNNQGNVFVRARFADTTDDEIDRYYIQNGAQNALYPRYASTMLYPLTTAGYLSGNITIDNNSNTNKTYYLYLDAASDFGINEIQRVVPEKIYFYFSWNEASIFYQKMNYEVHQ